MSETTEATVPRANIKASANLGKYVLKGIGYGLKIALLQSNFGAILVCQVVNLFLEYQWFLQKIDDDVESLSHSDEVGSEFWAVLALDVELLEEASRVGVLLSEFMEDSSHDGHLAVSVGRVPDLVPHVGHFLLVLKRTTVIIFI